MPGLNVDPAETLDLKEIILNWRQESVQAIKDQGEAITRGILSAQSSPFGEGRAIALPVGTPVMILAMDRARVRSLIRASDPDIFIGDMSQLSGGVGYMLPTQAGDEFKTTAQIFAIYSPSGTPAEFPRVFIWNERNV